MSLYPHRPALLPRALCGTLLGLACLAAAPAFADARAPLPVTALSWQAQVERISAGADPAARAAAITARLDELGLPWQEHSFEIEGRSGRNVIADLGGPEGAPVLLLGAHYDRVEVGHGANDNASGVAAVLELATMLKQQPLAGHRVQVAFWDLEERGLLGARAWVGTEGREQPALYVNFDVFGWGDTLWMMAPEGQEGLVEAVRAASSAQGVGFSPGQNYPPTDHLAFLKAGWPAVSFSLVGKEEIEGILAAYAGRKPDPTPKVMQVIHSERDPPAELDATHMEQALRSVDASLRAWDAAASAHAHAH